MKLESAKMRGFLPQSSQISVPDNELSKTEIVPSLIYEGWNFNSGNYLFTTDTK